MKIGLIHIMMRLLGCALVLFPHYALAGPVNIPGFYRSTVAAPPQTQLPVPQQPTANIPGVTMENNPSQNQLVIHQSQPNVIIDWSSFNIGAGAWTKFDQQGNASWSALNRIWDNNPSLIFGKLTADGKIYLINQNGIMFGPGSIVNVNSLVASALNITNDNFLKNNLHFIAQDYQDTVRNSPNYLAAVSNYGEIEAANGGYVFLMAPRVENGGTINAPAGQIGLAAGIGVQLLPPPETDTRTGYYVVVNNDFSQSNDADFGRAMNQAGGRLYADGGVAGMYGNNVNQWGVIRSVTAFQNKRGQVELRAANKITTYANSSIDLHVDDSVDPETGQLRTVNDTFDIQPKVFIGGLNTGNNDDPTKTANQIELGGSIRAPAGIITIRASEQAYLDAGSRIDVSGVVADLPLPLIAGFALNSVELRDSYAQKDGVLQGEKITTSVTSGSTIGDLSQAILTRDRTAQERLIGGAMTRNPDGSYSVQSGNIDISASNGDIIVKQGAVLDFSGGAINYAGGMVNSTKLLSGTKIYDISNAPLNIHYDKILGNYEKRYDRFGIRESYSGLYCGGASPLKTYMKGYTQSGDAGTLTLSASTVVLDGQLNGSVTRGQHQNTTTMQGSFTNLQDYNDSLALSKARGLEAPQAGTLNIGTPNSPNGTNNPVSISVLAETDPHAELSAGSSLPAGQPTVISATTLNNANLGALNLTADLTISTAADAGVMLQPGGTFSATARQIDHEGEIKVPAGSIKLYAVQNMTSASGSEGTYQISDPAKPNFNSNYKPLLDQNGNLIDERITLGSTSRLDVSGEKIDNSPAGASSTESLKYAQTAGGSIEIMDKTDSGSGVFIPAGAIVDVSGGYRIDQKGRIAGGNAGMLSLQGSNIQLDGDLRGYALADPNGKILGGSITLASTEIHVGAGASAPPPGSFVLAGDRLDDTGFTQITLNSRNDLVVESNTTIGPSLVRLNNPLTAGDTGASAQGQAAYGTELTGRQDLIRLDNAMSYMAGPSVFSAQAGIPFSGKAAHFAGNLYDNTGNSSASLNISSGAVISTTPAVSSVTRIANDTLANPVAVNTQISLSGPYIDVEGTLNSPGGNINVDAMNVNAPGSRYDLLIGENAKILVTGYNRPDPSSTPKGFSLNYQPVNGGNVSLSADRNLTLAASAWVDVSGSDAVENTLMLNGKITTYKDASSPGSVSLTYGSTAGGKLDWQGAVTARHAGLDGISGGSLKISNMDTTKGMAIRNTELGYYLAMGFDDLTFRSRNSLNFSDTIDNMNIGRKLTLDAPEIKGTGTSVALNAPWIVLTNTYISPSQPSPSITNGSQITLSGQWIDVIGDMKFNGFSDVTLQAARDIRLSQALYDNNVVAGTVTNGILATTGNLVLDAERIYPGNYYQYSKDGKSANIVYPELYSDYTLHADGKVTMQHTVRDNDTASDRPIYSAGGSLTVEGLGGIDVENGATLAAPLRNITLNAPGKRIYLADGSVVTTAGNTDVNYGLIDSSNIWVTQDKSNPSGAEFNSTPFSDNRFSNKSVTLNADEVIARQGSLIDVSGGGSAFGYKFQPGVEGSVNPLAKPGRYIVFKSDSLPMPGTAVYLQGGGGLSAGMYTLLPLDAKNPQNARYAFLPGAYILEKQTGTTLPGKLSLSKDGYPLVVGYTAVADTELRSSRPQVYSVRSAQRVLDLEGNYVMHSLTSGDAGAISITGTTTVIDGEFKASALPGYLGGTISLAAKDIFVQSSAASLLSPDFGFDKSLDPGMKGTMTVSADSLSGQGFSEVNLGDGNTNSVTVRSGAALDAAAIALTATQAVTVESNAKLGVVQTATGKSGTDQITLSTPGKLTVASGASVYASRGITLDVNDVKDISGELKSDSGNLTLESAAIFFGADNGKAPSDVGLYLTKKLWDGFSTFSDISLVSRNDIQFRADFTDSNALSAGRSLTLDAAQITGTKSATLAAPTVNFTNSGVSSSAAAPANAGGTFTVNAADQINIGGGDVLFGGFKTIGLNSANDLTFMGKGSLTTGNADLNISSARVTMASTSRTVNNSFNTTSTAITAANFAVYTGANYHSDQNNPNPAGSITISNSGGNPDATSKPGGTLVFVGKSIDQGGVIQVDGGSIKLSAMGPGPADNITLRSNSKILAQGTTEAPGGQVALKSANGGIVMESSSLIDVSAGPQGDAGLVSLQAPAGGVLINGDLVAMAQGGIGGSLVVDTYQTTNKNPNLLNTDMTRLIDTINKGGFTEGIDLRTKTGNIDIAQGQTLQARHVKLTADDATSGDGNITVSGSIVGNEGGSVELNAMNDLTIQSGGSIRAVSSTSGSLDPNVLLNSAQGTINVNGSINVSDAAGNANGMVYLRAKRNGSDVNITMNKGSLSGTRAVTVEAVQSYTGSDLDPLWFDQATSYYNTNTAVSRLAGSLPDGPSTFHLLPGIEVRNSGNIDLSGWDLTSNKYGSANEPGVLTIRATGNLNINGNLTDTPSYAASGYNAITSAPPKRSSWAFNLAAGADISSADPLAVNRTGNGDLNVANGALVYTESAPIRFASARDTRIGLAQSFGLAPSYTVPGYMINTDYGPMSYNLASFSGSISGNVGRDLRIEGAIQTATGDIDISVGRDLNLLVGNDQNYSGAGAIRTTGQLTQAALYPMVIDPVTGLSRQDVTQADNNATYYWMYNQGGNIKLSVGRNTGRCSDTGQWTSADTGAWDMFTTIDVNMPSKSLTTYGLFSADYVNGTAGLATMGGGDLIVHSGGDFLAQAGTFGAGNLSIYSGGDIKGRFLNHGSVDEPGRAEIHAMGNFGAFDPAPLKKNERAQIELFNSRMNVTAQGELQIGAVLNPTLASDQTEAYRNDYFVHCTYTPDTNISLKAGTDVTMDGTSPYYKNNKASVPATALKNETILPASVDISAGGDIFLLNKFVMTSSPSGNLSISASGNLHGHDPDVATNAGFLMSDIAPQNWYGLFSINGTTSETGGGWINTVMTTNHHGLYDPANGTWLFTAPLHEGKEDDKPITVRAEGDISNLRLVFPKQANVTAGNDIRDIFYEGQNINESDVSMIRAGGDIIMKYNKVSSSIPSSTNDGPRDGLIQGGPGVFMVQAGGSIDLGTLKDGIQVVGNGNNVNLDAAKSSLVILSGYGFDKPASDIQSFFNTIRTTGDTYAELMAEGKLDEAAQLLQTTRRDTIDPLLGAPTGAGDINMTSSQIATTVGQSDIFVIANGSLNMGQTALPIAGTANKKTGITTGGGGAINLFARQDINVNESRLMTFYGGDITVWSDEGSINAGRGSRTAVSASPPRKLIKNGVTTLVFTPPAVGSGIRAVTYGDNPPPPGNIHLFAPSGIIDAGEAGIAGGQITLAALQVNNAANISFSAGSIGMPQASEGAASLGTLAGSGITQNTQVSGDSSGLSAAKTQASQMVEDIIAKWLDVKVVDFVEDDNSEDEKK